MKIHTKLEIEFFFIFVFISPISPSFYISSDIFSYKVTNWDDHSPLLHPFWFRRAPAWSGLHRLEHLTEAIMLLSHPFRSGRAGATWSPSVGAHVNKLKRNVWESRLIISFWTDMMLDVKIEQLNPSSVQNLDLCFDFSLIWCLDLDFELIENSLYFIQKFRYWIVCWNDKCQYYAWCGIIYRFFMFVYKRFWRFDIKEQTKIRQK